MAARDRENALALVRVGIGLVILWFGVKQVLTPEDYIFYIPGGILDLVDSIGMSDLTLTRIHGFVEVFFAVFLVGGVFTRIAAFVMAVNVGIIFLQQLLSGSMEIAVRDFAVLIGTVAVLLAGTDRFTVDAARSRR